MPQAQRMVSIRKFKDWVTSNLTPDNPLYQIAARQKDELSLEEAIAQTEIVCALIDASVTAKALRKHEN